MGASQPIWILKFLQESRKTFCVSSLRLKSCRNQHILTSIVAIDDKRAAARDCIVTELLPVLRKKCSTGCNMYLSPYLENLTMPKVMTLSGISHWPPKFSPGSPQTIASIIRTLENRPDQEVQSYCAHQKPVNLPGKDFHSLTNKLRSLSSGWCLDCAIEGKQDLTYVCCIREHGQPMH